MIDAHDRDLHQVRAPRAQCGPDQVPGGFDVALGARRAVHDGRNAVDGRLHPLTGAQVADDIVDPVGCLAAMPRENAHVTAGLAVA